MKNHFATVPTHGLRLSVEEEAILMNEIVVDAAESTQDSVDLSRVKVVEEGVEATQGLRVAEPTTVDTALMGSVASMAVAGTDADPIDLFDTEDLSVEGVADTAKAIMDKVTGLLAAGWAKLTKTFRYWFVLIDHWMTRIEELEKNLAAAAGKELKDDKPLTLKPGLLTMHSFMADGKVVSQNEFTKQFADMTALIKASFHTMPEIAMKMAEKVCHAADTFKCDNNEKAQATQLLNAIGSSWIDYFDCFAASTNLDHSTEMNFLTSKKTMGDFFVVVRVPAILNKEWREENDEIADDFELLRAISDIRAFSNDLEGQMHHGRPSKFVIAPLSLVDIGNNLKGVKAMVDQYQSFKEGPISSGLEKMGKKLSSSITGHAFSELKSHGNKENDEADSERLFSIFASFSTGYLNWSKEPMTGIFYRLMAIVYGHLELLEKSLNKYA